MRMRRGRLVRSVALALLGLALGGSARDEIIDRVLAIIGGQVITLSDVHATLALTRVDPARAADPVGAALSWLIDRRLVLAEVDRYGPPEPEDVAIARRVAELDRALPADPKSLARLGLDAERVRGWARDDLRIDTYLAQRFGAVQPTDQDVARYYREHAAAFTREGVLRPLAEVQDEVRRTLADERRARLIADWVGDLRRRTDVNVLYLPGRGGRR